MITNRWCALVLGSLILALSACASGTNDDRVTISSTVITESAVATFRDSWPSHFRLDNTTYIGSGGTLGEVAAAWAADSVYGLQERRHGETNIVHGRYKNGVGKDTLAAYLHADAWSSSTGRLQRFGLTPPIIKASYGTSDRDWYEVRLAVQMINQALPADYQLSVSSERVSMPSNWIGAEDGEIIVSFARKYEWTGCQGGSSIGCAVSNRSSLGEVLSSEIWIEKVDLWDDDQPTDGRNERLGVIVHELLHALGRRHPDPYEFPDTVMMRLNKENNGYILYQLDREALLAVYSRFDVGTLPEDVYRELGPWEDTSVVVMGNQEIPGGSVLFGAAEMNGQVQAWASGPTPHTSLEHNMELQGSATWSGRLLGMTPQAETVGGAADLTVHLATLDGRIDFTGLESWLPGAAPSFVGTGSQWLDGDLLYPIKVSGNRFWRTWDDGDDGLVRGSFFGVAHEGMGGVLTREDLNAGFGGKR